MLKLKANEIRRPSLLANYSHSLETVVERRRANLALVAAKSEADAANRAKSDFLAGMSHELRTPLNAILGFSSLIRDAADDAQLDPRFRSYAGDVFTAGERLLTLIGDLFDLAQLESHRLELYREPTDLVSLLHRCAGALAPTARERGVSFSVRAPRDGLVCSVDAAKITRVFTHLLTNAVTYTGQGDGVQARALRRAGGRVVVEICDTGEGMSADALEQALEPFHKVDPTIARVGGGAGMGLSLAKAITELHGARFAIVSEPGQGTVVRLTFD